MLFLFAVMFLLNPVGGTQTQSIDHSLALQYFREICELSDADGGKLWGKSLYGPMFFVDPSTRSVVANQADSNGGLTQAGEAYSGKLPANIPVANTAVEWAGVRWSMVIWPPRGDQYERGRLLAHELFHRLQPGLGFISKDPVNSHLDTLEGRYWLQLERRALGTALLAGGSKRKVAVSDALLFRARRRAMFSNAAAAEDALELNEGLAEYTGARLCGLPSTKVGERTAKRLLNAPAQPTFVRSFAYETGPAYGLLLDALQPGWNRGIKQAASLSSVLQQALRVKWKSDPSSEAEKRAIVYGGSDLRIAEETRERERIQRISAYRKLLVEGPVLELPLEKMNFGFDPDTVVPLEEIGTVYPTLTLSDSWGTAEAKSGALITSNFKRLYLPKPNMPSESAIAGDGWTLTLKPGWKVIPGKRQGDFTLMKEI